jgi:hypothetical protein
MGPSRFVEAAKKRFIRCIEEKNFDRARTLLQFGDYGSDLAEERSHAHVDPERHTRHLSSLAELDRLGSKLRWQVVDAKKAEILERVERRRFTCARETGDDDELTPHSSSSLRGLTAGKLALDSCIEYAPGRV